jgi:SAM-dependent methyltransferase
MADWTDKGVQRRVISYSGFRLDGLGDLLPRAQGASVLDIGCNRGHVSFDLFTHGARVLHGCDNSEDAIRHANELFADYRSAEAKFEVVDLAKGVAPLALAFQQRTYDIVLFLAVYHKLRRAMAMHDLETLIGYLASLTERFFVWRGDREQVAEIEPILKKEGLRRVHYSEICEIMLPQFKEPVIQPAGIWARTNAVDRPPTK